MQARAISLPRLSDEAALRELDRKCAVPHSMASKRVVAQLAAASQEHNTLFLTKNTLDGLGNLVRCALRRGCQLPRPRTRRTMLPARCLALQLTTVPPAP